VQADRAGLLPNRLILQYINRLSSLFFILELNEIQQAGLTPTLLKNEDIF
jgi:cob(I)alamin adenosyltransferase